MASPDVQVLDYAPRRRAAVNAERSGGGGVYNVPSPSLLRKLSVAAIVPLCVTIPGVVVPVLFVPGVVLSIVLFPTGIVCLFRYVREARQLPLGLRAPFLADLDWRVVVLLANIPACVIGYLWPVFVAMAWWGAD